MEETLQLVARHYSVNLTNKKGIIHHSTDNVYETEFTSILIQLTLRNQLKIKAVFDKFYR